MKRFANMGHLQPAQGKETRPAEPLEEDNGARLRELAHNCLLRKESPYYLQHHQFTKRHTQ
jgi:hypothetical protein